jgi:hypothetical protein
MKRIGLILAALSLVGLLPGPALAAQGDNIGFDNGFPQSPAAGKVVGSGSYKIQTGEQITSITLNAAPQGGGQGGSTSCKFEKGAWTGSITGLATGTYDVQAVMVVTPVSGGPVTYFTSSVQVKVQ